MAEQEATCPKCGATSILPRCDMPDMAGAPFYLQCSDCGERSAIVPKDSSKPLEDVFPEWHGKNVLVPILLGESTDDQFFEEMCKRFSTLVFSGVSRFEDKCGANFKTLTSGEHIVKLGLCSNLNNRMDHESVTLYG